MLSGESMATNEEEYFARIEAEKRERLAAILADEEAKEQAASLKALHHMHCGKCGQVMKATHFKGVEIDVCTVCSAVLLDPGELELLAGEDRAGVIANIASVFGIRTEG